MIDYTESLGNLVETLDDCFRSIEPPPSIEPVNVVDGLFAIAKALDGVARAIRDFNECEYGRRQKVL